MQSVKRLYKTFFGVCASVLKWQAIVCHICHADSEVSNVVLAVLGYKVI